MYVPLPSYNYPFHFFFRLSITRYPFVTLLSLISPHSEAGDNAPSAGHQLLVVLLVRLVSFVTYLTILVPQQIHTEQERKKAYRCYCHYKEFSVRPLHICLIARVSSKIRNHSGVYSLAVSLNSFGTCHFG